MKRYVAKIKLRDQNDAIIERSYDSNDMVKLGLKFMKAQEDGELVSCETVDRTTGKVIDSFTGIDITTQMNKEALEHGVDLAAMEDENILLEASTKDEDLIAVGKIAVQEYNKSKKFAQACAVHYTYKVMKSRGLKDPTIKAFVKKHNLLKLMFGFSIDMLKKGKLE
jgi:hypothetical protein